MHHDGAELETEIIALLKAALRQFILHGTVAILIDHIRIGAASIGSNSLATVTAIYANFYKSKSNLRSIS